MSAGVPLCVATYNIHQGIGRDGRRDLVRVGQVLQSLDADLVALQEVEGTPSLQVPSEQMFELADLVGYEALPGPTILAHDRLYGNVLLTRLAVEQVEHVDLSVPGREPRGAIMARLRLPAGGTLRCVATHFGLSIRERWRQAGILASCLSACHEDILLLMGDFNVWSAWSPVERAFGGLFGTTRRLSSFPSWFPLLALDRIWVRPQGLCIDLETVRTPLTRITSDHLPLVARIRQPEERI